MGKTDSPTRDILGANINTRLLAPTTTNGRRYLIYLLTLKRHKKQQLQSIKSYMKLKWILLFPIRCTYYAQNKLILVSWYYPGATFHKVLMYVRTTLRLRLLYKSPTCNLVQQCFLLISSPSSFLSLLLLSIHPIAL